MEKYEIGLTYRFPRKKSDDTQLKLTTAPLRIRPLSTKLLRESRNTAWMMLAPSDMVIRNLGGSPTGLTDRIWIVHDRGM